MTSAQVASLLTTGAALVLGCETWFPDFVEQQQFERVEPIDRVAVVPFYPATRLSRTLGQGGGGGEAGASTESAAHVTDLVTRFVSEALLARVQVIPENDVQIAFEGQGVVTPRQAPELAAMLATSEFGADAVLLGEVRRFREREGSAIGSIQPASVEFEVSLYDAPSGTRLWVGRFSYTQTSLTSSLFDTARLPGHGSRFLTAAELARFGAERVAAEMPLGR